ncbi:MAG: hypothetical protein H0Z33_03330 [Bacillaceae bacterium]|nr:hypothetical protein [Bacillaceae bacterium]
MMHIGMIDDGVFTVQRVFIGFYQWIYLMPLIGYLVIRQRRVTGVLIRSLLITAFNFILIVWILIDPGMFI